MQNANFFSLGSVEEGGKGEDHRRLQTYSVRLRKGKKKGGEEKGRHAHSDFPVYHFI